MAGTRSRSRLYDPADMEEGYRGTVGTGFNEHDDWVTWHGPKWTAKDYEFGAKGDGVTDDTDALIAFGAAIEADSEPFKSAYIPPGDYLCSKGAIIHLGNNALASHIYGAGPNLTRIIATDNWGSDEFVSSLNRHGSPNNLYTGPHLLGGIGIYQASKEFNAPLANYLQANVLKIYNCYGESSNGSFVTATQCQYPDIQFVCRNYGYAANGQPTLNIVTSEEGGLHYPTYGGRIRVQIENSGDHAIRLFRPEGFEVWAYVDGAARTCMQVIDALNCWFYGSYLNGADDCIQVISQGRSLGNHFRVTADGASGSTPGTGYGINFLSTNSDQLHVASVDGSFGFNVANFLGDIKVPSDGGVVLLPSVLMNSTNKANAPRRPLWATDQKNMAQSTHYVPDLAKYREFILTPNAGVTAIFIDTPINYIPGMDFTITIQGNGTLAGDPWNASYKFPSTGGNVKAIPANTKEQSWTFGTGQGTGNFKVKGGLGGII